MFSQCAWQGRPPAHRVDHKTLLVVTDDRTDFWRITSYGFIRDDGHFFAAPTGNGFTAQVHVRAAFTALYDQAGLMVRVDERQWLKAGVEFSDGQPMLSTVLTSERSDWATAAAPPLPDGFWLRISVGLGVLRVQYSANGTTWPLLRLAPFPVAERYLVGPMCCSPHRAGLQVEFGAFSLGPYTDKDLHDLS